MSVNNEHVKAGIQGRPNAEDGTAAATTRERIAYLRGLLQAFDFSAAGTGHKRLWDGLVDVVDGLVRDADALRVAMEEQDEYIDAMDEALWNVEERLDEEDEDVVVELEDGEIAVECPNCGEAFVLEPESMSADGETRCPECGKAVALRSVGNDGELRVAFSQSGLPATFTDDHNHIGNGNPPPQGP